jgi:hypothetical protein
MIFIWGVNGIEMGVKFDDKVITFNQIATRLRMHYCLLKWFSNFGQKVGH